MTLAISTRPAWESLTHRRNAVRAAQSSTVDDPSQHPGFGVSELPLQAPPSSPYLVKARLALTCAQALPMLATVRLFARPAPGLDESAIESEQNTPRQSDVQARQDAITIGCEVLSQGPRLTRSISTPDNLRWLGSGFQLILGAGFFGMYQHAGVLRALASLGLHQHIQEICGLSSGAITGALYAALGPDEMTKSILGLTLLDFLDLSPSKFIYEGALCAGKAVEEKIAHDTGLFGCTKIEDVPGPKLCVAVFDGEAGKTMWHTSGPLAKTVAQSAALPVLFANEGYFDGGWVDHHGFTALRPGQRALSLRMNTGLKPDAMQELVCRPNPLFNISTDPEHKTVALQPKNKITGSTFLLDIDFRKQKLVDIINECEGMFKWWLFQPQS